VIWLAPPTMFTFLKQGQGRDHWHCTSANIRLQLDFIQSSIFIVRETSHRRTMPKHPSTVSYHVLKFLLASIA
jgi:hypothetical protein